MSKSPKYLGTEPVDLSNHPEYGEYTITDFAMLFIEMYGGVDGAHHKTWVLDQVSRILKGTPVVATVARWDDGQEQYRFNTGEPSAAYLDWVGGMLGEEDENGDREYEYDSGIAP